MLKVWLGRTRRGRVIRTWRYRSARRSAEPKLYLKTWILPGTKNSTCKYQLVLKHQIEWKKTHRFIWNSLAKTLILLHRQRALWIGIDTSLTWNMLLEVTQRISVPHSNILILRDKLTSTVQIAVLHYSSQVIPSAKLWKLYAKPYPGRIWHIYNFLSQIIPWV